MNKEINKSAATNIPLSPEEAYLASQLFGKGLFSALQLAKERERQKAQSEHFAGNDNVLRIPIPANLMPSMKTASSYGEPAYVGVDGERELEPELTKGRGALSHVKRNIGKYIGSYGGGAIGAAMGAGRRLPHNTLDAFHKGGKGMLMGSLIGTGLGELYDKYNESQEMQRMRNQETNKANLIKRMMASGELERILNDQSIKTASSQYGDLGLVGRALNTQNNPVRLLAGGQQGFHDARREYFMKQRENIQQELQDAQKEYIDLLSKIKTAEYSEDSTPCVDSFCNGIAYAALFGKKASDEDVDISDDSVSRLIGDLLGAAKRPFQPAIDTAAGGLLNTGVGAAYLTHQLRKELRNKPHDYTAEQLPTKVELQPYN